MNLILTGIPVALSEKLIEEFLEVKKRYLMNDWGSGQLKGGRFAEVVIQIFQHFLNEPVTPFGTNIPGNEKTRILNKVQTHQTIDEHIREKTTSLVRLLLDFRNNRDSAHLGGFDANSMDALFVMTSAIWTLCEIVRVYGGYPMPEAQKIIDGLAVKDYPAILEFEGEAFITRPDLKSKEVVLVLLSKYQKADADLLFSKTGDRNVTRFNSMLDTLVSEKFIGKKNDNYFLMPRGIQFVAAKSLLSYS